MNDTIFLFSITLVFEIILIGFVWIGFIGWKITKIPCLKYYPKPTTEKINNTTGFTISGGTTGSKVKISHNGKELTNITSVIIDPILPNKQITAKMTVIIDHLDINAYKIQQSEALAVVELAKFHGEQSESPFYEMMKTLNEHSLKHSARIKK